MAEEHEAEEHEKFCETRNPFEEIHFISILSQTNVYGLTKFLEDKNGCNTLLFASLKGTILSISSPHSSRPSSLSSYAVPFKNIQGFDVVYHTRGGVFHQDIQTLRRLLKTEAKPRFLNKLRSVCILRENQGNVDVVSIDAFNYSNGLAVGITFVKGSHTSNQKQYLNIYSNNKPQLDSQLESIIDSCQTFELDFVPFHLYHTELLNTRSQLDIRGVFLLSGGDEKIHVFKKNNSDKEFTECQLQDYFPEFQNLPSSVIWMDICHDRINKRRISSFACQNGFLKVTVVDEMNKNDILNEWTTTHDGPVSSVRIFTLKTKGHKISQELDDILPTFSEMKEDLDNAVQSIHVLVTGVIEPSVIYQDVLKCGLSKLTFLPDSEKYDCVVCSHISDVDWDGHNEILLGTYGQELLVYKLTRADNDSRGERLQSKLCWKKSFSQPLFAIDYVDLTDDGLRELIVTSSKGLHVLQHKFSEVTKRFQEEFAVENKEEN